MENKDPSGETTDIWQELDRKVEYDSKWLMILASTCWIPIVLFGIGISAGILSFYSFPWALGITFAWFIYVGAILAVGPTSTDETALASHGSQFDK